MVADDIGSTVPLRQLGRHLSDWRSRAGLTQSEAARLMGIGVASINRMEHGKNSRLPAHTVKAVCELYGVPDDVVAALVGLAMQAKTKSWWHQYGDLIPADFDVFMGLEAAATQIDCYAPHVIPGLLQSNDYATSLLRLNLPDISDQEIGRHVEMRAQRQKLITRRAQPAAADFVIDEAALRRGVGGPRVMVAQARHLLDLSTRDNICIRILPYRAGFPGGLSMNRFVILQFGTSPSGEPLEPPVVYLEGERGSLYLQDEDDVQFYANTYSAIRAAALDPNASRAFLRDMAREYERDR